MQYVYMYRDQTLIIKMYFYVSHEPGMVPSTRNIMVSVIARVSFLKYTVFLVLITLSN